MFTVSGATGHVGSVVAKALLDKKQKVRVLVRETAKGDVWSQQGAELAVGSLDDQAFLTAALEGATGFFAMLPPPPFAAGDFHAVQRKVTNAIAGAVKASGVGHVVMLSSLGADLPEGTGPIRDLHYLERSLESTGTQLTAIRAAYFQENVASALGPANGQGIFPNFLPDGKVPMVATRDIGELAAQCLLERPAQREVIDLLGPQYSAREVAEKLGAALGKKLQVVDVPQKDWVLAMTQAGFPRPFAEVFAEMYGAFAKGAIRPHGDRLAEGKTSLDDTIRALVG